MRLADVAWNEVDTTTIKNCWKKAGILPDTRAPLQPPTIPILALIKGVVCTENELNEALNQLQSTGFFTKRIGWTLNFFSTVLKKTSTSIWPLTKISLKQSWRLGRQRIILISMVEMMMRSPYHLNPHCQMYAKQWRQLQIFLLSQMILMLVGLRAFYSIWRETCSL